MTMRCAWVPENDALYATYHDKEWGVPTHDEHRLFEMLLLEGAQAGLTWRSILQRRENYRAAFDNFDPSKMAVYDETRIQQLVQNPGIIRNRMKIRAFIQNAQAYLNLRESGQTLHDVVWDFVDGQVERNCFARLEDYPSETETSRTMARALKKRGFSFVGPTICYAYMQSCGLVNDHMQGCFLGC